MDAPVVVVGLGGVGSHCAHALLRAATGAGATALRHLRLVDFDRVSLSSLNRHAVALRRDVPRSSENTDFKWRWVKTTDVADFCHKAHLCETFACGFGFRWS